MNETLWSSTNQTSPVLTPYTPLQATLIGISAGLLSLVTIAGNLMVMISFKLDKQLQTISNYFLFSLAVADIIIGSISMPLFTVFIIQQEWTLGRAVCDSWLSVDYLASNSSVLNLLVISFDRYFSVTRPLTYRARRTTKKAALMIFSAWAISAVVWPPSIVAWPYIEGKRTVPENDCYIQFIYSNEYMSIVTVMIAFFLPVSIMIFLYVRVWWETVKRQRELVHLQAGKRVSSKRSDSSDETVDDNASKGGGVFKGGWRTNISAGSNKSKESQDLTYMPTAMLKSRISTNSLAIDQRESTGSKLCSIFTHPLSCCALAINGGIEDASSEGGYTTPRSLETPVQIPSGSRYSTMNPIRDPYASRHPVLRQSASIEDRFSKYHSAHSQMQRANSAQKSSSGTDPGSSDTESIYTILIRFPPRNQDPSVSSYPSNHHATARRVPSIQMLPEEESASLYNEASFKHYPRSLPIVRRVDTVGASDPVSGMARRRGEFAVGACRSANPSVPSSPAKYRHHVRGDDKVGPSRHILRPQDTSTSLGGGATSGSQNISLLSVASSGPAKKRTVDKGKGKKPSSEKKQDRKAAKTLSAILLAFIVTWTPYSVLVVLNAILGKEAADNYIPSVVWDFSYYLCYINSTVNPVLYALCNAAFRRTYVRILTCRWGSRARQPINRYYYG